MLLFVEHDADGAEDGPGGEGVGDAAEVVDAARAAARAGGHAEIQLRK